MDSLRHAGRRAGDGAAVASVAHGRDDHQGPLWRDVPTRDSGHSIDRRLGFHKIEFLQFFVKRPPKTCPLDQFSLLITNMASDFARNRYFCMIFTKTEILVF